MAATPVILKLFTADPMILANGTQAILCIFPFYFLYAINQVYIGGLKGLGKTGYPMLCSLICYCIFRVAWCRILLPFFWDIRVIYFSYDYDCAAYYSVPESVSQDRSGQYKTGQMDRQKTGCRKRDHGEAVGAFS